MFNKQTMFLFFGLIFAQQKKDPDLILGLYISNV
jgi:hypothetical protein